MQLQSSAAIHFPVHAFPFLIELAITSKIFRLLKLIKNNDRILIKVGVFSPLLLLIWDFKSPLNLSHIAKIAQTWPKAEHECINEQ